MFCDTSQVGASAEPYSLPISSTGGMEIRQEAIQTAAMKERMRRVVRRTPYVSGLVIAR